MKAAFALLLGLAVVVALGLTAMADEKGKEVTLKGTVTCAKCDLKEADKCHTVIKVKEKDKDVIYWFTPDTSKKFHKEICTEAKKGTVKGTVTEKDKKMWIEATEVKYD
jgi:hypothetical protein